MSDRRVIGVACRLGDLIVSMAAPARHHIILMELADAGLTRHVQPEEQGFLLSDGAFVDRRAAYLVASEAKQMLPRPSGHDRQELYSEDLW